MDKEREMFANDVTGRRGISVSDYVSKVLIKGLGAALIQSFNNRTVDTKGFDKLS